GVYSREILRGLPMLDPDQRFHWYYRPHRFLRSLRETLPERCSRRILWDGLTPHCRLFHALNQRMPRRKPRRSVVTFHDLFVLTGEYSTPEFRARFAAQARDAAARADLIICVSQFAANQVHDLLKVERSRLRVVWHGVHPPAQAGNVVRENTVLHVGALQMRKNVSRLVDAFEQMPPDWSLVLAGSAGFGAGQILSRIEHSRARERIRLLGYVDDQQLSRLYQTAGMLAFPSLDEGFGIPLLEAMAHGLPVITSNRSALREVGEGAALLVDPEDTEEISEAMRRLATDHTLRNNLTSLGFERAAQHTWRHAARNTWNIYQEVMD
ncbi:MAG: glycosyltransferase family 4 protein, partial [Bryobacterales bacterium]|nr:glycosyltransferase family 4 protein [Bryobacterales bacterium]